MDNISKSIIVGGLAALLAAQAAQANTLQSILLSAAPSGPNTIYTYQLELTPNNGLQGGDTDPSALVILDFPGVVSVDMSSLGGDLTSTSDWSLFTTAFGAGALPDSSFTAGNPGNFILGGFAGGISSQDGEATNIVLQYTGAGVPLGGGIFNSALLHLTITSTQATFGPIQTLSRDSATHGINNEVDSFPISSQGAGSGTPEPASLGLLACGLSALLLRRRK